MTIFKEFTNSDIKTSRSFLNNLVDVIQEDVSGSVTRRKYQVWVTGSGYGPGVTSSLFQTVYDQDFSLQTANAVFDMTVGLYSGSSVVTSAPPTIDTNGKYYFPSQSLQMREKMDIYRQFAGSLLGDSTLQFSFNTSATATQNITEALFLCFKRLFSRDQIRRESFAIQLDLTASALTGVGTVPVIYTDMSSSITKDISFGGQVSLIVNSANTAQQVGMFYLDRGIAVLDISQVFAAANSATTNLTGTINSVGSSTNTSGYDPFTGSMDSFLFSASIDNIVDHIATSRFGSAANTAMTFQNITDINSSLFFCQMSPDEFNYSSNPTFTDSTNRIVVIDEGQEETQRTFSFITSIGLYDAQGNLLAVAKASRPILKSDDRQLNLKIRLDF